MHKIRSSSFSKVCPSSRKAKEITVSGIITANLPIFSNSDITFNTTGREILPIVYRNSHYILDTTAFMKKMWIDELQIICIGM